MDLQSIYFRVTDSATEIGGTSANLNPGIYFDKRIMGACYRFALRDDAAKWQRRLPGAGSKLRSYSALRAARTNIDNLLTKKPGSDRGPFESNSLLEPICKINELICPLKPNSKYSFQKPSRQHSPIEPQHFLRLCQNLLNCLEGPPL